MLSRWTAMRGSVRSRSAEWASRCRSRSSERRTLRASAARALHVRLRDEHRRRRKTGANRRHDVSLRGGVVACHDADAAGEERQWPLAGLGEETLGSEARLELLEGGEVGARAEALDRERA